MSLGVVVNYCSIDSFLWPLLKRQIEVIADAVVVVRRTHLFGGEPEKDVDLGFPTIVLPPHDGNAFDACTAMRKPGVEALPSVSHVLLLDSDELFQPERLHEWIGHDMNMAVYFPAEWYWRVPTIRTKQKKEVAGLFARIGDLRFGRGGDRERMVDSLLRPRLTGMQPMHHFSWCKPFPQMLAKVRNWGHKDDRPWRRLLIEEWGRPLPGKCFVHPGRELLHCTNLFGITL